MTPKLQFKFSTIHTAKRLVLQRCMVTNEVTNMITKLRQLMATHRPIALNWQYHAPSQQLRYTCAFLIAGPTVLKSPPDNLRNPAVGPDQFRRDLNTHLLPEACSTAHRSNRPDHWDGLCKTGQLLGNFHPYPVEQNGSDWRQAIHYVVYRLPAYSTGELLNTPLVLAFRVSALEVLFHVTAPYIYLLTYLLAKQTIKTTLGQP